MTFLTYLISGLALGSVYAIIALGYTMVYGIAKMLNFAHGDIIMAGGYVAFFAFTKMPTEKGTQEKLNFSLSIKRLAAIKNYRNGVIAQFFYVGAQIMCWTFIIQYGTQFFTSQGMEEQSAEVLSQGYNIAAMILFCCSRFICTYLLRFINPGRLLGIFSVAATCFTIGAIVFQNIYGLYSLVAVSACMSLMFPTIYGIALEDVGEEAKLGAAGLIMAILGGSVLPPLQAMIIDRGEVFGMPAVNISFVLPLISFIVIFLYAKSVQSKVAK